MIIDSGYLYSSISCIKYLKNGLSIVYEECYMYRSGEKEDIHLLEILNEKLKNNEEFKEIDIYSSSNYYLKCKESIIKSKEKLSASGADTVNVEIGDLYKDEDFTTTLSVDEINNKIREKNIISCSLATMIFRGFKEFERRCKDFDIKKCQCVIQGGSCRIPFIQESINGILEGKGIKPSVINQTLNLDESVSNGCCYYELIKEGKWVYNYEEYNPEIYNNNKLKKHKNKQCSKDLKLNKSIELSIEEKTHVKEIVNQAKDMIKKSKEVDLLLIKKNDYESELYSVQNRLNNSNISSEKKENILNEISNLLNELKEIKVVPGMNIMSFEGKINELKSKLR